jgi:cytochrome c oxidase subunit 2
VNKGILSLGLSGVLLLVQFSAHTLGHTQPAPRRIEVHAKRFEFQPSEITLKKGEPVVLVLETEDVPHGLRFRELNVDIKAKKDQPGETQFTPETTGDFTGHCSVFCGSGHGSMAMKLHVVD